MKKVAMAANDDAGDADTQALLASVALLNILPG